MIALGAAYVVLLVLIFGGDVFDSSSRLSLYPRSLRQWTATMFRSLEFATVSLGVALIGIREWVGDPTSRLILTLILMTGLQFVASALCWRYDRRLATSGALVAGTCALACLYLAPVIAS
jgi:hypothetical protein